MDRDKIYMAAAKLVAKGAYRPAIQEYQKILEADPEDVRALQKLGELYQKTGDNPQAAHCFTQVAEAYAEDGFLLKAVALYKVALGLNPTLLEVNLRRAELLQQLGLRDEALACLQQAATDYGRAGDIQKALDILQRMVDLDPDNVATREKLAELRARAGGAREPALAPAGLSRERLSKLLTETDVFVKYGLYDKGLEHLQKQVFAVDPENLEAHEKAYQIYVACNDPAQALEQLLNVLRLCAHKAEVRRAQPYLDTLLQQSPEHPEVPELLQALRP